MKKFLIPCKTQESLTEMKEIFGNNENLSIYLHDDKICGLRGSGVLITNDWTADELNHIIIPLLIVRPQ